MSFNASFSTAEITTSFINGIQAERGKVRDTYDDGRYLYIRSVLPYSFKVTKKDKIHGGLALKSTTTELWLHPYLFRQVCRNGLIAASTMQSVCMEYDTFSEGKEGIEELALEIPWAIRNCARKEFFQEAAGQMKDARKREVEWKADYELKLLSMLNTRHGDGFNRRVLREIRRRFEVEEERTLYGMVNATTSMARDTRDPALKWRLEQLGWKIARGELAAGSGVGGTDGSVEDSIQSRVCG
ncbi:MAG: hypothetical protein WC901_04630 [Candidatus Margulisiibacteriota bacterium]